MQVEKNISIGNIVSWALIAVAFIVSYGKLQGNVLAAQEDAREARMTATSAINQINELRISLARMEERLKSIDTKVDDIKKATTKP